MTRIKTQKSENHNQYSIFKTMKPTINPELKKAIFTYMMDNSNEFQLVNKTTEQFRRYIYTEDGEYCFGGEDVANFISKISKL